MQNIIWHVFILIYPYEYMYVYFYWLIVIWFMLLRHYLTKVFWFWRNEKSSLNFNRLAHPLLHRRERERDSDRCTDKQGMTEIDRQGRVKRVHVRYPIKDLKIVIPSKKLYAVISESKIIAYWYYSLVIFTYNLKVLRLLSQTDGGFWLLMEHRQ